MIEDWYAKGLKDTYEMIALVIKEGIEDGADPLQIATTVYGTISETGLIDYDIEKDVFYEYYNDED